MDSTQQVHVNLTNNFDCIYINNFPLLMELPSSPTNVINTSILILTSDPKNIPKTHQKYK